MQFALRSSLRSTQGVSDQGLRFFLNPLEMLFPSDAFGVEFIHILGAGGAGANQPCWVTTSNPPIDALLPGALVSFATILCQPILRPAPGLVKVSTGLERKIFQEPVLNGLGGPTSRSVSIPLTWYLIDPPSAPVS